MKLTFTLSAQTDLVRLRAFIAEKNPQAAKAISRRLKESIQRLSDHPQLGHEVEEVERVRDWIAGPYVVRYLLSEDRVTILRIWHGREDY